MLAVRHRIFSMGVGKDKFQAATCMPPKITDPTVIPEFRQRWNPRHLPSHASFGMWQPLICLKFKNDALGMKKPRTKLLSVRCRSQSKVFCSMGIWCSNSINPMDKLTPLGFGRTRIYVMIPHTPNAVTATSSWEMLSRRTVRTMTWRMNHSTWRVVIPLMNISPLLLSFISDAVILGSLGKAPVSRRRYIWWARRWKGDLYFIGPMEQVQGNIPDLGIQRRHTEF